MAGKPFWVRPLTASGWADLLAWLDDEVSGREDRKGPPRTDDPASKEALASPEGEVVELWLALRDQGVDYAAATDLWKQSSGAERRRVHRVLFARRRTAEPIVDDDSDIAESWCGKGIARIASMIGIERIGDYTFDQIEWLLREGDNEDENPAFSPENLAKLQRDMQEKWGEKLAALKSEPGVIGG